MGYRCAKIADVQADSGAQGPNEKTKKAPRRRRETISAQRFYL